MDTLQRVSALPWRGVVIAVLLLPLITTGYRLLGGSGDRQIASCQEISTLLERADVKQPSGEQPLLFLGRGRVKHWDQRVDFIEGIPVMLRSAPNFDPVVLAACFERTIAYYQPAASIIFLEEADLNAHKEATWRALNRLVEQRDYFKVSPQIFLVPPIQTPRHRLFDNPVTLPERLQWWVANTEGIDFIDVNSTLTDGVGAPDPSLFWPDGSTLAFAGYRKLEEAFAKALASHLFNR